MRVEVFLSQIVAPIDRMLLGVSQIFEPSATFDEEPGEPEAEAEAALLATRAPAAARSRSGGPGDFGSSAPVTAARGEVDGSWHGTGRGGPSEHRRVEPDAATNPVRSAARNEPREEAHGGAPAARSAGMPRVSLRRGSVNVRSRATCVLQ